MVPGLTGRRQSLLDGRVCARDARASPLELQGKAAQDAGVVTRLTPERQCVRLHSDSTTEVCDQRQSGTEQKERRRESNPCTSVSAYAEHEVQGLEKRSLASENGD